MFTVNPCLPALFHHVPDAQVRTFYILKRTLARAVSSGSFSYRKLTQTKGLPSQSKNALFTSRVTMHANFFYQIWFDDLKHSPLFWNLELYKERWRCWAHRTISRKRMVCIGLSLYDPCCTPQRFEKLVYIQENFIALV